jgi:hypothetical protein
LALALQEVPLEGLPGEGSETAPEEECLQEGPLERTPSFELGFDME